jgi:hypothetical protein
MIILEQLKINYENKSHVYNLGHKRDPIESIQSTQITDLLFLKNIKPKQSLTYYKYEFSIPKDLEPIIMDIFKYELDKWSKSWPTYKWVGSIDGKNVI